MPKQEYLGISIMSLYSRFYSQLHHSFKLIESENTCFKMKFSNNDIIKCFKSSAPEKENVEEALNFIKSKFSICDDKISDLKYKLSNFDKNFKVKWHKHHRIREKFDNNNKDWLNKEFNIDEYLANESSETSKSSKTPGTSKRGRPAKEFSEKSERSKRRNIAEDVKNNPDFTLEKTLRMSRKKAYDEGNVCLAKVISKIISNKENSRHMLIQLSKNNEPKLFEEYVACFLDNNYSVAQWDNFRKLIANEMPCYRTLLDNGLKKCCPEDQYIHVTDTRAKVDLQQLMKHTAERIVKIRENEIMEYLKSTSKQSEKMVLLSSWGLDGSSGHAQYHQSITNPDKTADNCMLATVTTPLRLSAADNSTNIHWTNLMPQSVRFCRPIEIEFVKETREVTLEKKRKLEAEMENLEEVCVKLPNGNCVSIKFEFIMSQIDGKTLAAVTETSSTQCCCICGATPTEMTNSENLKNEVFAPKEGTLDHGMSPLHAYLRVFDCLLHIAYRLQFKKWRVTKEYKDQYQTSKKEVQQQMKDELHLHVDFPRPGGGTSTTGNVCRRAFSNPKELSRILKIDEKLIVMFRNILIAINCQQSLNPELFQEYCTQAYQRYLELYSWYKIPATVHKVLAHAAEIIIHSPVPLGVLAEEALECSNKHYRRNRELHARKCSRQANMRDIFIRAMRNSDPLISSYSLEERRSKKVVLELPDEVKNFLVFKELASSGTTSESDAEETEVINLENEIMDDLDEVRYVWTDDENLDFDEEENE